MTSTFGTSTQPVRIGDNATPGSGSYEIYLNPLTTPNRVEFLSFLGDTDFIADLSGGSQYGATRNTYTFRDCRASVSNTNLRKLKSAIAYWANSDILCYLTVKDKDGTNKAEWPAFGNETSFNQIRCRVIDYQDLGDDTENYHFNITVKRYTA